MNRRQLANNILYRINRALDMLSGDAEGKAPDKALMVEIRKELLNLPIIYQRIPFKEFKNFPYYRDPAPRLELIRKYEVDFKGKSFLDLGSCLGYYCFSLAGEVKRGVGLEGDEKLVKICNMIKRMKSLENIEFYNGFITPQNINKFGKFDFTIFFSTMHHILPSKEYYPRPYGWDGEQGEEFAHSILDVISKNSKRLYFEMGVPYEAGWEKRLAFMLPDPVKYIQDMLSEHYPSIKIIRPLDLKIIKHNLDGRPIFLCE
ncbi:MAG: methyltransferase domain-containing protein [Candidatus Micrarchaeia archaeon]